MDRGKKRPASDEVDEHGHTAKDRKKIARKLKKGGTVLSNEEYRALRNTQEENRKKNAEAALKKDRDFPVDPDVHIDEIAKRDPELHQQLLNYEKVRVRQTDSLYRAKAIWLNRFDDRRTFWAHDHNARMNFCILSAAYARQETLHPLEYQFLISCIENDEEDPLEQNFDQRNLFIKMWVGNDYDLKVFSKKERNAFSNMRNELGAALPVLEGAKNDSGAPDVDMDEDSEEDVGDSNTAVRTWREIMKEYEEVFQAPMSEEIRIKKEKLTRELTFVVDREELEAVIGQLSREKNAEAMET